MSELKMTDPLKLGYYAYHVSGGKVDDCMRIDRGYLAEDVARIIADGWSFVCRTKKYRKGQTASIPKSQIMLGVAPPPPSKTTPNKLSGLVFVHNPLTSHTINCMDIKNAYDKLIAAMTEADYKSFLAGNLCLVIQIIQTPEKFKPPKK